MEIRDPIHGNISLNETELKIIETPEMQRLRYIRQLDMSYLIFPGANHSRFEHSLGTMQVVKDLTASVYGDKNPEFSYVGLLHDIAHGPFSHASEDFIIKYLKKNHEQIGEDRIRKSEIRDIISDSGLSFDKIMSYFREADKIEIVGGTLGADRIDYLMRDSHYTGVAYGIIEYERIRGRLVLSNDKVSIGESGVSGAESLLIARYFMHSNVYAHHTKVIAQNMLQRAISSALEKKLIDPAEFAEMNDFELIGSLLSLNDEDITNITNRVLQRGLFKRTYYKAVKNDFDKSELENAILESGLEKKDFVVHVISLSGGKDDIEVVDSKGNVLGNLTEISPLIKTLNNILTDSRKLLVACDNKNFEKVNQIIKRFAD